MFNDSVCGSCPRKSARALRVTMVDNDPECIAVVKNMLPSVCQSAVIVGGFVDPIDSLSKLSACSFDIALVDLLTDGIAGLTCTHRIREQRPAAAVIMLSSTTSNLYVASALRAGARGFLSKPFRAVQLRLAICSAANGMAILSEEVASALVQEDKSVKSQMVRARHLNKREIDVLDHLVNFLENKEIADRMSISVPLARKVLHSAFQKLGVRTRSEAIVAWRAVDFFRNGVTPPLAKG